MRGLRVVRGSFPRISSSTTTMRPEWRRFLPDVRQFSSFLNFLRDLPRGDPTPPEVLMIHCPALLTALAIEGTCFGTFQCRAERGPSLSVSSGSDTPDPPGQVFLGVQSRPTASP